LDEQLGSQVSPVAQMRLKKDGGFQQTSDARPTEEIEARLGLVEQTILHAAGGVVAGEIDVAPLLDGGRLPCDWCAYRPVCRFERAFNRIRVAEVTLPVLSGADDDSEGGSHEAN
jgi:ATP-dependent helicase/nuclease subunit B